MKIIVVHDGEGIIRSVTMPAAELDGELTVRPPSGLLVSVVESPEELGGLEEPLTHGRLFSIRDRYTVHDSRQSLVPLAPAE
jgi:hypothetical protein